MAWGKGNKNYDILDDVLSDSQRDRSSLVWVDDPRHPQGGYYVDINGQPVQQDFARNDDAIERYLRS